MSNRVVWFDIPVEDLQRASKFYQQVLAVSIQTYGGDMPVAVMEHGPGDVAGCLFKSDNEEPSMHGPILYFAVEGRLQEATDIAAAQGGQVIQAPQSISPHGNRSLIRDSEGNRIALHSESWLDFPGKTSVSEVFILQWDFNFGSF